MTVCLVRRVPSKYWITVLNLPFSAKLVLLCQFRLFWWPLKKPEEGKTCGEDHIVEVVLNSDTKEDQADRGGDAWQDHDGKETVFELPDASSATAHPQS